MPFKQNLKAGCVLYALLLTALPLKLVTAQGYSEPSMRTTGVSGGLVGQLSRGETPSRSRSADRTQGVHSQLYQPHNSYRSSDAVRDDQNVVALRPQPMSVRHASFETSAPSETPFPPTETNVQSRRELDRLNAQDHLQSFIDREQSATDQPKANATDMITKIGINLMFVLALAVGGVLLVKQFQKGKMNPKGNVPGGLAGLKIDQVLPVARGVSLYLVDSAASKILVAVDGGGIKSVNVLPGRFEDELDDPDAFRGQHDSAISRSSNETSRSANRRSINKTSSSNIDENLIRMLLSKSKEAA